MKNILIHSYIFVAILLTFVSCKDKDSVVSNNISDEKLFSMISEPGYVFYKTEELEAKGPHKNFVRVRFNSIAAKSLNSENTLEIGKVFEQGSMVVKEVYTSKNGPISLYAVAYKSSTDPNQAAGWVWTEFSTNGTVLYSSGLKGVGCISCHDQTPNRDKMLLFDTAK